MTRRSQYFNDLGTDNQSGWDVCVCVLVYVCVCMTGCVCMYIYLFMCLWGMFIDVCAYMCLQVCMLMLV